MQLRLGLGMAGVIVAAAAVALNQPILGWISAGLLAASLLLRLIEARRIRTQRDAPAGPGDER
ncbi:MAG: hypothetical protein ABI637_07980 [Gemmatimonadota bacterium]